MDGKHITYAMSLELWDIVLSNILNTSYILQEGPRISVSCSIEQLDNDLDNVSDKVIPSCGIPSCGKFSWTFRICTPHKPI